MNIKGIKKRIIAALLLAGTILAEFNIVTIDTQARTVSEIEKEQKALQKEIDGIDNELYSVVLEIEETEYKISELTTEIEETQASLESAKDAAKEQYASMKIRIQYMYENNNTDLINVLLDSGSISDFLNRVEYITKVRTYDDDKMNTLEVIVEEITSLEIALEGEKSNLETVKADCESKKESLNKLLTSKKKDMANLSKELEKAKEAARQAAILAAQKKAAEEKAAREAAAKAQAEAQAKALAEYEASLKGQQSGGSSNSSSGSGGATSAPAGSTMGLAVVAYASQFVGNPYVWGGTSLTNGCDCSGFVTSVYRHFGYDFGRLTSGSCRSIGREVSYSDMQAGDIVCYDGHVGIYTGYGTIVEAQNTSRGITNTRSVNCHPIITIRRLL